MTSRRLAEIEEQLEAEEAAVRRFSQYVGLARDPKLRESFALNLERHEARCADLRRELRPGFWRSAAQSAEPYPQQNP